MHVMHKSVVDWLAKDHAFGLSIEDMKSAHVKVGEMCAKISGEILGAGRKRWRESATAKGRWKFLSRSTRFTMG